MKYITVGHVRHRGVVLRKGELLPKATKEEIEYLLARGAIIAIAPSGEIVEEAEENSEEEVEEYSDESDSEEYELSEPPEIDAMEGVVSSRRRRGGKS